MEYFPLDLLNPIPLDLLGRHVAKVVPLTHRRLAPIAATEVHRCCTCHELLSIFKYQPIDTLIIGSEHHQLLLPVLGNVSRLIVSFRDTRDVTQRQLSAPSR